MKAAGSLLKAGLSPLMAVATAIIKPKKKALPVPLPTATREDARARLELGDELRRRRGGAADIVAGAYGGGEPMSGGGKATLGGL